MTRPDENKDKASFELSDEELKKIVAEADTGGRKPTGLTAQLLLVVALAWSLFQLWIASPLPFSLGVFVFNDTESRAIHLAFAVFLAFADVVGIWIKAVRKRGDSDDPRRDEILAAAANIDPADPSASFFAIPGLFPPELIAARGWRDLVNRELR